MGLGIGHPVTTLNRHLSVAGHILVAFMKVATNASGYWAPPQGPTTGVRHQVAQLLAMQQREIASLYFEPVVPVTAPHPFQNIAQDRHTTGLPLTNHVEVLMQYQVGVSAEGRGRVTQIDPAATRGCPSTEVKTAVQRVLDHLHMVDGFTEHRTQCRDQRRR